MPQEPLCARCNQSKATLSASDRQTGDENERAAHSHLKGRRPTKPLGGCHVLPTSTWVNPPFTGDLRRWGAQVMEGCAVIQE